MPISDSAQHRPSAYGRTIATADTDRELLLAEVHGRDINVFKLVQWLGTMEQERFWQFPTERGRDGVLRDVLPYVHYTTGQQLFMSDIWREVVDDWKHGPEGPDGRPHLLDFYYADMSLAMYRSRLDAVPTGTTTGADEETQIPFDSTMDVMLNFVLFQLPVLKILHELDQPAYDSATAATVRQAIRDGFVTNPEPFEQWLGKWVQYHVRYYIRAAEQEPGVQAQSARTGEKSSHWNDVTPTQGFGPRV
ncbi:hypothetical protein [Paraburkholderia kururiensis]|uniref:Uncharacterized protein n=1 Tax=Paraburkholderia kururiensis TaxID=984307 RepID=A0ABZ0WUZ1_9BURK|nr:hypothetical protein [Paraburkholderia kururiensis]WQD81255.1 hypothetical protein U0042_29900 [Paraburkholderia kururiensis]